MVQKKSNPVLQEFLEYHPGKWSYHEEADEEQDVSEIVERLNIEVDALVAAKLDLDQIGDSYEYYLGINLLQSLHKKLKGIY
jgi:hypothetical protein